jgi:hypothetical protein
MNLSSFEYRSLIFRAINLPAACRRERPMTTNLPQPAIEHKGKDALGRWWFGHPAAVVAGLRGGRRSFRGWWRRGTHPRLVLIGDGGEVPTGRAAEKFLTSPAAGFYS